MRLAEKILSFAVIIAVVGLFLTKVTSSERLPNSSQYEKIQAMNDSIYNQSRNDNINYYTVLMLLVKCKEGYSEKEYRCPAGVKTRGWGITSGELQVLNEKYKFSPPIRWRDIDNKQMADSVLRAVLEMRCAEIKERYRYLDAPAVFALTSFVYNLGPGVLESPAIRRGLQRYQKGDKLTLGNAFLGFSNAKVGGRYVYLDGLRKRRELEKALLLHDFSPYKVEQLRKLAIIKSKNPIR